MSEEKRDFTRRDFLGALATGLPAAYLSGKDLFNQSKEKQTGKSFSREEEKEKPIEKMEKIFSLIPKMEMSNDGRLRTENGEFVPQFQTVVNKFNAEKDRKFARSQFGILLHFFGEDERYRLKFGGSEKPMPETYMVGFGESTSAAFVVGEGRVPDEENFGIIQTEKFDRLGVPYKSAHCCPVDEPKSWYVYKAYRDLYPEWGLDRKSTVYFDFFKRDGTDPNLNMIGIESVGKFYDTNLPENQVYANTLGLLMALMERYEITANNIFGHHELDSGKPDPGKMYLHAIRQMLLVYVDSRVSNPYLKWLTFDKSGYGNLERGLQIEDALFRKLASPDLCKKNDEMWPSYQSCLSHFTKKKRPVVKGDMK